MLIAECAYGGVLWLVLTRQLYPSANRWYDMVPGVVLLLSSTAWLLAAVPYGMEWQGTTHVITVVAINIVLMITMCAFLLGAHIVSMGFRVPFIIAYYVVWFVLCLSYAFPYLGELP